jgi:hypothetical protein
MAQPTHYGSTDQAPALGGEPGKPDAQVVEDFHTNAEVDVRNESIHHTTGPGPNQAATGDHNHDGGAGGTQLLAGTTISGSRAADAWRLSVNAALVKLGAIDASTP